MVPKTLQLGAKMAPRPSNLEPRWPQDPPDGPKTLQLGANMAPRPPNWEPRWPQDHPNSSQDTPKSSNFDPRWSQPAPRPFNLEPTCPPRAPTSSQNASQLRANMPLRSTHVVIAIVLLEVMHPAPWLRALGVKGVGGRGRSPLDFYT